MSSKVFWLVIWTTLSFWLGSFWGCASAGEDQNYKILREPEPRPAGPYSASLPQQLLIVAALADPGSAEAQSDDALPMDGIEPTVEIVPPAGEHSPVIEDEQLDAVIDQQVQAREPLPVPTSEPLIEPTVIDEPRTPAPANEPPAIDTQRTVMLSPVPEIERSLHGLDRSHWQATQVGTASGASNRGKLFFRDARLHHAAPANAAASDEDRLAQSLAGGEAGNWNGSNALDLLVQPVNFAVDLVLIPVRVFTEPAN